MNRPARPRCMLLILVLLTIRSSSLLASVSAQLPMKILDPKVVMLDTAKNEVRVTLRGQMLFDGDMAFSVQIPAQVADLPDNADVETTATRMGLTASSYLDQSVSVHLPDTGHFGFYFTYRFAPSTPTPDVVPHVVKLNTIQIYVTIVDGELIRWDLSPDLDYTQLVETVAPRGVTGQSDDDVTITVDLSGRIAYRMTRPLFIGEQSTDEMLTFGVPGVKVMLDWDITSLQQVNHPTDDAADGFAVTDMDGNYRLSFSFQSSQSAQQHANRIRLVAERLNAATFDGYWQSTPYFSDFLLINVQGLIRMSTSAPLMVGLFVVCIERVSLPSMRWDILPVAFNSSANIALIGLEGNSVMALARIKRQIV